VHVALSGNGSYEIDEVIQADTVSEVLDYVDYSPAMLLKRLRDNIETALRHKRMSLEESRQLMQRYREGLASQTYLE